MSEPKVTLHPLAGSDQDTLCEWFAACGNKADGYREHPIIGDVPCCTRCAAIGG